MLSWFRRKPKLTPRQVKALTWIMEWEIEMSADRIGTHLCTREFAEDECGDLNSILDLLDEHGVKTAGLRRQMANLDAIYGPPEKADA